MPESTAQQNHSDATMSC